MNEDYNVKIVRKQGLPKTQYVSCATCTHGFDIDSDEFFIPSRDVADVLRNGNFELSQDSSSSPSLESSESPESPDSFESPDSSESPEYIEKKEGQGKKNKYKKEEEKKEEGEEEKKEEDFFIK